MSGSNKEEWHRRRVERCESWIAQAEEHEDNVDVAFVCWWIAFNALYGYEDQGSEDRSDRNFRVEFFETICKRDEERRQIYDAVWKRFSDPIRTLMSNDHAYGLYWKHINNEISLQEYESKKKADDNQFNKDFKQQKTANMLKLLFDRLYVLRNQIMHGNATWNSSRNRSTMRDGQSILSFLIPVFLGIIKSNPEIDLGKPYYFAEDR